MAASAMAGAMIGEQMEMMTARKARRNTQSVQERNRELFQAQQRAQRGPTPEVFFAKHIDNTRLVKADDPERKREMRQFAIVMSMLFVLVMVYVWQHFSAIEIGYKVEAQKQQVEQLREENRQLRLNEAQLTDPERIDRIARQLGLSAPQPGQIIRPDADASGSIVAEVSAPALAAQQ